MEREIGDHKKHDLGKVCCDNFVCGERGDYGRCYLDIYVNCVHYKTKKEYDNTNRNQGNGRS